jgi:hypothetical protein
MSTTTLNYFFETVTCFLIFSSSFTLASDFNTSCSLSNDTSYCAEEHARSCDFNQKI